MTVMARLRRLGAYNWCKRFVEGRGLSLFELLSRRQSGDVDPLCRATLHEMRAIVRDTFGLSYQDTAYVFDCDHASIHGSVRSYERTRVELAGGAP